MKKIEELRRYFTKGERALWFGSVFVIIAAFYFFHLFLLWRNAYLCRYDYADGGVRSYFLVEKPV